MKMAGLFKAAYRWLRDEPEPAQPELDVPAPVAPAPSPIPPPVPQSRPTRPRAATQPDCDTLHLPLQPVLDTLPDELKSKVRQHTVGALTIPIPLAKIIPQLARGAVSISFGELRLAAPEVFSQAMDADHVVVGLPLGEILPRLGLAKLARRSDQKVVAVPDEVISPFGARGKGLVISTIPDKAPGALPGARAQTPPPAPPGASGPFSRGMTPSAPSVPVFPPRGLTPALPPRPAQPTAPPKPANGNGGNGNGGNGKCASVTVPQAAAVNLPPRAAQPTINGASGTAAAECLAVPLLSLMNAWPQSIRLEIAQMNLMDAKVVLPVTVLERGLRQGKVEFPWKLLRAWIRPELPPQASPQDGVALGLPLSVVAPLFIALRKPATKSQRKVTVDETIPNLFFGFPQGGEAVAGVINTAPVSAPATAKSPDTNFYSLGDYQEEKPRNDQSAPTAAPITDFLKRGATPNEIVARATALPGVAGAVVALPDGLAVASRVPATYNSDTLAAFLPQIFGKVSQCTSELRMGALNNLNFTVGNVPWKIFRVNAVFFAVFGRAEEPLPSAQIAALAAELDRKPKSA